MINSVLDCTGSFKGITPKGVKPIVNLSRKKLQNTSLSEIELQVILGGLLGDGSLKIAKNYRNARYCFRHSNKQKEYFFSKYALLESLTSPGSLQEQKADGFSTLPKLRFQSRALPSLTDVHSMTHVGNQLVIKRSWLNHCTALSLAIWWFDDGSIVANGRQGCFCTDSFSKEAGKVLEDYFQTVFGIKVKSTRVAGNKPIPGINSTRFV